MVMLLAGLAVVLGTAGLTFKLELVRIGAQRFDMTDTVVGGVGSYLFLIAGVIAHVRQPTNRVGLLMVLVSLGSFAEDLQLSTTAWVHTAGLRFTRASNGFLTHLVLAFPGGRLGSWAERLIVGVAYAAVFLVQPVHALFDDTRGRKGGRENLLFITSDPAVTEACNQIVRYAAALVAVGVAGVLLHRWVRAELPRRRVLKPVFAAGLLGGAGAFVYGLVGDESTLTVGKVVYGTAYCALPLGLLAWMLRVRLGRTEVSVLLARLRESVPAAELRGALARALGDPSLQVGYWRAEAGSFIDGDGRSLAMPPPGAGREVKLVERDGRRIAALVYDPALREDGHLLDAVTAAAALVLENQRLTAEVRAQLAEVRASRGRIVTAADAERRRLERDLHDGAQQRLLIAMLSVQRAMQRVRDPKEHVGGAADTDHTETFRLLADSAANLDAAIRELREFARGVHPAILTDAGLVPALAALVERTPLEVRLVAHDVPRLPAAVEATAYFVVAEALTNALRHARAEHVRVTVAHAEGEPGGELRLEVADDGVGGADVSAGSGLLGLSDRVSALDGRLIVRGSPGRGTTVSAVIPCAAVDPGGTA